LGRRSIVRRLFEREAAQDLGDTFGVDMNSVSWSLSFCVVADNCQRMFRSSRNTPLQKPLGIFMPGMQAADVALSEIGRKTLTYESTPGENGRNEPQSVIKLFRNTAPEKRAA